MEEKLLSLIVSNENKNIEPTFKNAIVFGAGKVGKSVIYILKLNEILVSACFDNKADKVGEKVLDNIFCETPKLIDRNIPLLIAVENMAAKKEIYSQCEKLGYVYIYNIDVSQLNRYIDELSDEEYLKLQFQLCIGYPLNLENPRSFNEKLQWLKLHDRNPQYTKMVDKYEAKKYIADKAGEEYIIPTLGIYNTFDDIDFDELPEQFVLKCTHDSGSVVICKDKDKFNRDEAKYILEKGLGRNYYRVGREWPYKNIKPRIIAEKYLKSDEELIDYKLMCMDGKVKISFTCSNRFNGNGLCVNFYDRSWKPLSFERHYPKRKEEIERPKKYNEMLRVAEKLSVGIKFIRIDFYSVEEKIYVGEMTFYPGDGLEEFTPVEWDYKLGELIEI